MVLLFRNLFCLALGRRGEILSDNIIGWSIAIAILAAVIFLLRNVIMTAAA